MRTLHVKSPEGEDNRLAQPDMAAEAFARHETRYLDDWRALLRIPSISTDPARSGDCATCAAWLADRLRKMGFDARLLETGSKPVVYGERTGRPGLPVILFYGHYDVQPVDPLDAWESPPFEPTLRGGRLYARGAQDNKGQLLYALHAMEALIAADALGPTVKILLEGEEESGSQGLTRHLGAWQRFLTADILLVTDTGTVASGAPTLIMGLRGIIHLNLTLAGPSHDLHSGMHGGLAPNPAAGMARLLASLHDSEGRIAVAGFCDGIEPPTARERALAATPAFDAAAYRALTGVPPVAGEPEYAPAERLGFRPTIDVNGVHSGFGGEGTKTIIPAAAIARLTARLVPGQDPERCLGLLAAHLRARVPAGLRLEITHQGVGGPGFRLNPDSPLAARARTVLSRLSPLPAVFLWEGASIPVVSALRRVTGAEALIAGFGREEDRIHAPNESFSIEQYRLGFRYVADLLASF